MSWSLVVFLIISVTALVSYAVLLIIALRGGLRRAVDRYFAVYLASMLLWSLGAVMMYVDRRDAAFWNKVLMAGTTVMPLAFYSFVQAFRGREVRGPAVVVGLVAMTAMLVLDAFGFLFRDLVVGEHGIITFNFGPAMPVFAVYYLSYLTLSALGLLRDLKTTQELAARNRLKYILVGVGVIVVGGITNIVPVGGAVPLDVTGNLVNALIITYAISRYQLLDLNFIVRKTLVYSLSTALVVIGYLVIVFLGVDLLHLVGGMRFLLALLVGAAVALVLQPVRDATQAWVDRLFFHDSYDAGLMLQRLSRQVALVVEPARLAQLILDELSGTMHASAALLIRSSEAGEFACLGAVAQPPDEEREKALRALRLQADNPIAVWLTSHDDVLPVRELSVQPQFKSLWSRERADLAAAGAEFFIRLAVGRELVGIMVLGARRSEAPYTSPELRTLQTLANQVAVAVKNAWLYGEALAEKERAQTILEAAFAGIVVVDQQLRIVTMNPSAEAITGRGLANLKNRSLVDLLGTAAVKNRSLAKALAARSSFPSMEVTLDGGSESRVVLLGMTSLRDGFLLNFADITQLKEVDRLKSEIVANVSHELRGPLASIKGYTELLMEEMDGEDRAVRRRFLSVINEEADRLASFINDLLDLTRLESGHVDLALAPVSLEGLLSDVVRSMELQASAANIAVEIDVPRDMPPVMVDEALVQVALKNLLSNAIKFSPCGTTVEMTARPAGATVIIDVVDHGPGIEAEDLPYLFTKFYRGRAARDAGIGGTGLGLVLVREAIERHRGSVTVDSEPGCGARFSVVLPLDRTAQEETDARESAAAGGR